MKPRRIFSAARLSLPLASAFATLLGASFASAQTTYTWDSSNVTGTPAPTLDWFTGGSNPLGLWTGAAVPVSSNLNTIRFFADTATSLPNTAVPSTQTANLNNGGTAFQLGTLALNGFGSATSGASLTMTLQGDALNFSGATGTISFNSVKNVAPATDPVINYTINNNIQLGTASSASALTLTGNGDNAGTTTYKIDGAISELQTGGGSLIKSGTSLVTVNGAINFTGGVTVSAGTLTLSNSTINASTLTVNGGTLIMTGSRTPASGSMTVNTGGILQIGNNTATQYGPAGVYSGNISTGTGGTLRLWSSATQEITGVISGSGGVNKAYAGALTLSGANTYTGRTSFVPQNASGFTANVSSFNSVVGGTSSSSLGAPTTVANGTIDVGSGTAQAGVTLNYTGAGETTDRVLNIVWNGNSSHTISNSGSGLLKFTSAFTLTPSTGSGSLVLTGAGNGEITQGLSAMQSTGLSKTGSGTWTLGGTGGFTAPTTITGGFLRLSSATALQNSPFNTASSAGTGSLGLRIDTTTLTLGGLTGSNPLRGRFTTALGGPSSATAQGGYDGLTNLTLNTIVSSTYSGAIAEGATGMTLTKTGTGTQILSGAHGYTGTTFVNGGLLQLNGSNLAGGLSVSNATFASNSTFAGVASVTSGGVISPGASSGAIGTLTLTNATSSALTLGGSTGIFDLSSTDATTPDRIAVTGGLVVDNTNTILLRTPTGGTAAGTYTLITAGSSSGAGSFVLANGSATRGNATISMSGSDVILTVAAGGLAGTTTFNGPYGSGGTDRWNIAGSWSGGVPTGTINAVIPDQTSAQVVAITSTTTPSYTGDLWIGNNVTLQVNFTSANAAYNNALGTAGSTIIYMGQNSAINYRNNGFNPTMPAITLLGDASMRFQESTQLKVDPNFANPISGPFTLTLNSGAGNGFSTHTLNAANSFAGLNLAGTSGVVNAAVAGSIGTANLTISGGGTVNLNHATAISDGSNAIRINNGTVTYGSTAAAALTLSTRPIELNGSGQATINNNNTASSSANILTLGGGISSTASGAKTLTLGGTNVGLNLISGNITDGTGGGTIGLSKTGAGTWQLSGDNSYTGATAVSGGTLILSGTGSTNTGAYTVTGATTLRGTTANAFGDTSNINIGSTSTLQLRGDADATFGKTTGGAAYTTSITADGAIINVDRDTVAGTNQTFTLGAQTITSTAASVNTTITGANNTSLALGAVTDTTASGGTITYTNNITGGGSLTLASFAGTRTGTPTLAFAGTGNTTVTGNISQTATQALTKSGTGNLSLNGASNSFTGTITLSGTTTSAGTLSYASAAGTNPITFTATTGFGSTLSYTGAAPLTMSGLVSATALTSGGITIEANGVTSADTINYSNALSLNTASTSTSTRFITFGGANTGDNTFAGAISNNTGVNGNTQVAKIGAGKWVLTGNSNFTGGFFLNEGTVSANTITNGGVSSALGANTRINLGRDNNTGTLIYTGGLQSTNRDVRLGGPSAASGTGGSTILNDGTGALTFTAATFNPTQTGILFNRTLTLGGSYTGAANEITGTIQNNTAATGLVNLEKTGAGTWTLSGNNTYSGTTTVSAGILRVNGSHTGGGAYEVASTGTLQGTGSTTSALNVSGVLSPGASIETFGSGTLNMSTGSTFAYEVDSLGLGADLQKVTGDFNLTGLVNLTIGDVAGSPSAFTLGTIFSLINYTGSWNSGEFTVGGNAIADEGTFTVGLNTWRLDYDSSAGGSNFSGEYVTGGFVNITAVVPEPSTALLTALGVLALLRRRR